MRKYCYQQIDELVQPIMDFMRTEYPNDCKMIITADFAHITHEHDFLIIPSAENKSPIFEKKDGE